MTDHADRAQTLSDLGAAPTCDRCGSSLVWEECERCNGFGTDPDDAFGNADCPACESDGGAWQCASCNELQTHTAEGA